MGKQKLKVGVVGTGKMGALHIEKYLTIEPIEWVGIFDNNETRLKELSRLPVRIFSNLSELIFEVDAVSVCTPTASHFSVAREALASKVHVLVEKPIAPSSHEAEFLIQLARKEEVLFQAGFLERFRFKRLTQNIELPNPFFIESSRHQTEPGREKIDVVSDLMIHDIDLSLRLFGNQTPSEIIASGQLFDGSNFDYVQVLMKFDENRSVLLNATRHAFERRREFKIYTEGSHYFLDFLNNKISIRNGKFPIQSYAIPCDPLLDQCQYFIDRVLNPENELKPDQTALLSQKVVEDIRHKITTPPYIPIEEKNREVSFYKS